MRLFTSGRYAAVTSTLALVVACGGASYAAVVVTGAQIKDNTVTTRDVKNNTIKTRDLSRAARDALTGATGPAGPAGPAGAVGPAGPAGPAAFASKAYSAASNNAVWMIPGTPQQVASLSVPEGTYAAFAKATIGTNGSGGGHVQCELTGGGRGDQQLVTNDGPGYAYEATYTQLVFSTAARTDVTLSCFGTTANYVTMGKVVAVSVASTG